jgi:uncharacterized membrane protein YdbT with pleckstrin-like domain
MQTEDDVVYRTGLHWVIFLWPCIIAFLGIFLFFKFQTFKEVAYLVIGFSLVWLFVQYITYQFSSITIKTKRVVIRTGLLVRQTLDLPLSKMESIDIRQSIIGSLLGFGTIIITGTGGSVNIIDQISHPLTCRRHIEQMMHNDST